MHELHALLNRFAELETRLVSAEARATAAEALVLAGEAEAVKLRERVRELEARLKLNSSNSSKPPSSDIFRGGQLKKRKSGRKAGGQPGHKGVTRAIVPPERIDVVVEVSPTSCTCGADMAGAVAVGGPRIRQVFEIPEIRAHITEYRMQRAACPCCGRVNEAQIPPEAAYGTGPTLTSWIAMLSGEYRLPRQDVVDLCARLLGVPVSKGTVQACCERVSEAVAAAVQAAEATLSTSTLAWIDETGWRQKGVRRWLWGASTNEVSCFAINTKRGAAQFEAWFDSTFNGVLHSDRWVVYGRLTPEQRQLCWAHLLRDVQGIADAKGAGAIAARALLPEAHALFSSWHRFCRDEIDRPTLQTLAAPFITAFRTFGCDGETQRADKKWYGLGRDSVRWAPAVFRFIDVEGVEPTNNREERNLRHAVQWRRITQGTRSEAGSKFVGRILTVLGTCTLQHLDTLRFVKDSVLAALHGRPPPSLLTAPNGPSG